MNNQKQDESEMNQKMNQLVLDDTKSKDVEIKVFLLVCLFDKHFFLDGGNLVF